MELRPDGGYDVMKIKGRHKAQVKDTLPIYLRNRLNMLMLVDNDTTVEGLGYRYTETIFYIEME